MVVVVSKIPHLLVASRTGKCDKFEGGDRDDRTLLGNISYFEISEMR